MKICVVIILSKVSMGDYFFVDKEIMSTAPKDVPKTIRVFVRIRPPNSREIAEGASTTALTIDPSYKLITVAGMQETFTFHHVFPPKTTQDEVFDIYAKDAVERTLDGFHSILFAYGQTGSGKTHTLSGSQDQPGVLQRCLQMIWDRKNSDTSHHYKFEVSYVELYNEMFTDLLGSAEDSGLTMHQTDECTLTRNNGDDIGRSVSTINEAMKAFDVGSNRKAMAETAMNDRSSRSHTIFTVYISKQPKAGGPCFNGRLILCDLAGSERQSKTKAQGTRLDEAKAINTSLMQLGIVVKQLAERKAAPSFRNSKLTQLLRYSLSGRGCTSIIINVSPAETNKSESIGSMRFGQCAITIKQEAERHVEEDYKSLSERLNKKIAELESRLQSRDESTIALLEEEYNRRVAELREEMSHGAEYNQVVQMAEHAGVATQSSPDLDRCMAAIKILKGRLEQKEHDLQSSQSALVAVTHQRDTEKEKALLLARILRDKQREWAVKESALQERIDNLRVAGGDGADLNSMEVTKDDDVLVDQMTKAFTMEEAPRSPRGERDISEVARLSDELVRAQRCIAILRDQRVVLRSQLNMAKQAIRMLHEQKTALETAQRH